MKVISGIHKYLTSGFDGFGVQTHEVKVLIKVLADCGPHTFSTPEIFYGGRLFNENPKRIQNNSSRRTFKIHFYFQVFSERFDK